MISAECWVAAHLLDRDVMGCFAKNVFQAVEHRHVGFYFLESEIDTLADFGSLYLDELFVARFFQRSADVRNDYFRFYSYFKSVDLDSASNALLATLLAEYWNRYRRITAFFNATIGFYLEAVEKKLKSILLTELEDPVRMQETFSALTRPVELDIIKLEELDLAKLRSSNITDNSLLKHAEKHAWFFFNTYSDEDAIRFLKMRAEETAASAAELEESFMGEIESARRTQIAISSELKQSAEVETLAERLRRFGHDRLELKAVWSGSEFRFRTLFRSIAERLGISLVDLMWGYRASEIQAALTGMESLPTEAIAARKDFYIFRLMDGRLIFNCGEEAKNISRQEIAYGAPIKTKVAKGTVAHPGVAEGPARLVFLRDLNQLIQDLDTFQTGDIMVTQMTQPTMVAMAKKAQAIVTDEGGITSHAAIIARELDIPCIVGCKVATKIFRTGDTIRVDGTNAEVTFAKSVN